MNEPLYTFDPTHAQDELTLYLSLFIGLLALVVAILLLRRRSAPEQRNRRLLGAMLAFFIFLIAAGTAFFSGLFMRKIGPVHMYESKMETSYGEVAYPDIRNAYIHVDKQPSMINPNITRRSTRMLVIEEKDGRTHVLPEENYPIEQILGRMREIVNK